MDTNNSRKIRSLRTIVLVFLLFGLLGVGALLFVVFHSTVPQMLLHSEDMLLEKQQRSLSGLFDSAMRYTYQMADDTAQFDETALFAQGKNPDFIKNNWFEGSPVQNYRMNFMFIKSLDGKDLYSEWYDYLNGVPLEEPPGLSSFLDTFREKALARFYEGRSNDDNVINRGVGGVFLLNGTAYSVAAMPVLPSAKVEHPCGILYMGSILSDAYFKDITRFDSIQFTIIGADNQKETAFNDERQKSDEYVTTTLTLPSLTGAPIRLHMSDRRAMYLSGKAMLDKVELLLTLALLLFSAVLYLVTDRFVLRPMVLLNNDISLISEARTLDPGRYSHSQEFARLCASINEMVERLRQSTTAMDVLRIVLNGMESFIYVVDPKTGRLLFVNDTMLDHCRDIGIAAVEDEEKVCWERLRQGLTGPCEGCPFNTLDPSGKAVAWELHNPDTGKYFRQIDRMIDWLDGRRVQLHHSLDISGSKHSEERLKKRLEQQSLMSDIARSFITAKDTEAFIDNALGMAGEFLELSRLLLIHLAEAKPANGNGGTDEGREPGAFETLAEWLNPERRDLVSLKNSSFAVASNDAVYHEIAVNRADHVAITAFADANGHEWLTAHGAKSILVVPVYNGSELWGLLCFDDTEQERNWSRSDIQLGVLIGSIISAVIGRAVTADALLRMSSIVDSSPQSILLLNRDGVFEYANPGAVEAFGFSQEELVGSRFDLVIGQDLGELFKQDIIPTILDGEIPTFDLPIICKNGEERFFNYKSVKP
ncbi:PAS domain-containing protein, partial [Desulfovibrio sp. OttesenSCG-928-G15]|nr:PAS domain-containing protein [Desulfovibrio sp. OttesenSCG-928-G15]